MSIINEHNIVASSEKIIQKAEQARFLCEKLLSHMRTIESKVDASAYFWSAESSQLLYKFFEEDKLDYNEIQTRLQRQIEHLNQIATLYHNSEKASQEAVSALPDKIIK